mmetsp:Transcript_71670/g.115705  ORF Transcript_71670/g.115705 Transcript_71670/m.115705 type:complete len:209 (+) Transcript_71670:452-1078(+)
MPLQRAHHRELCPSRSHSQGAVHTVLGELMHSRGAKLPKLRSEEQVALAALSSSEAARARVDLSLSEKFLDPISYKLRSDGTFVEVQIIRAGSGTSVSTRQTHTQRDRGQGVSQLPEDHMVQSVRTSAYAGFHCHRVPWPHHSWEHLRPAKMPQRKGKPTIKAVAIRWMQTAALPHQAQAMALRAPRALISIRAAGQRSFRQCSRMTA